MLTPNGSRIGMLWESDMQVIVSASSPAGDIEVDVAIDLDTLQATGATVSRPELEPSDPVPDDTAPRGDVGLQVSVDPIFPPVEVPELSSDHPTGSPVSVDVSSCGTPIPDAFADLDVINENTGASHTLPMHSNYDGSYTAYLPTEPTGVVDIEDICASIELLLSDLCEFGTAQLSPINTDFICSVIDAATQAVAAEVPDSVALLLTGCDDAMAAISSYCDAVVPGTDSGDPALPADLCDRIADVMDSFEDAQLLLVPTVEVPGVGVFMLDGVTAPATGPFPEDFYLDVGGLPEISDLSSYPVDPLPFESYTITVQVVCAASDTQVTVMIVGTDGFAQTVVCAVTGGEECNVTVPGALQAGVHDTITVDVVGGTSHSISVSF